MYDSTYFIFLNPYFATVHIYSVIFIKILQPPLTIAASKLRKIHQNMLVRGSLMKVFTDFILCGFFWRVWHDKFCLEMVST
jgi:hypothetical protein